ncbi:aminoglycoside phosphotransferase family protein [Octadecabacter sp. R77987]|uniref:aminoglycoside phosphotransferase family protein n=1 Tax=Octadecabacter sp. R77987 TaxID=3093874 RepID=UPI00366D4B12
MTDRAALITELLAKTRWARWARQPLAGDASARRYERLTDHTTDDSVILMDSPPRNGEDTASFLRIAKHLGECGLHAPEVLFSDTEAGILILEDLGDDIFARWIESHPQDAPQLYRAAIDVLAALHNQAPPDGLQRLDPETGAQMVDLIADWYAPGADISQIQASLVTAFCEFADGPYVLALRDYHAENLIWLPDQHGVARVGLLDFQDALLAHPVYDLVSLLRDARRDVDPGLRADMIAYFAQGTQLPPAAVRGAFAVLGVQRNLRILGIFARLSLRDGKTRYLRLIPRVWAHLVDDLNHPGLAALRSAVLRNLPEPDAETLNRLAGANA